MNTPFKLFAILITTLLAGYACATSESVTETDEEMEADRIAFPIFDIPDRMVDAYFEEFTLADMSEDDQVLYLTRSRLRDGFESRSHHMPDFYLQQIEEVEVDEYQGFRIQVLSTRDIELADRTVEEFEVWADSTIANYSPTGYVHFRPPYYRVRIGDFHNRDQAIELSRILKFRYPDAWVIHDQVNPYRVPADTVDFRFADFLDSL